MVFLPILRSPVIMCECGEKEEEYFVPFLLVFFNLVYMGWMKIPVLKWSKYSIFIFFKLTDGQIDVFLSIWTSTAYL